MMKRECGDCQLCCKLLPMKDAKRGGFDKAAGVRCQHQRHHKGCAIYANRPWCCEMWSCRWLVNDDTADLSRPDRSHYVIDLVPDYVTVQNNETGDEQHIEIVQVWIDPHYPDAHRDPALRRYMVRRAEEGKATMIRYNERDALTIFAPAFDKDGQWHEIRGNANAPSHTLHDTARALGSPGVRVITDAS
jgi:hypothetical protein